MTPNSLRFLALHTDHMVTCWKWLFAGMMLRATTDTGLTATISRTEADELVRDGRMRWGAGGNWMQVVQEARQEEAA